MKKKKQYASMQEELAARKAAAGFTEEPRARLNSAEAGKNSAARLGKGSAARLSGGNGIKDLRAKFSAAMPNKSDSAPKDIRKSGIQLLIGLFLGLFVVGLVIAILIPNEEVLTGPDYPFDEATTDDEIIEYIDERWSIDDQDYRKAIRLMSWENRNKDALFFWDIGEWDLDVSENFVIIRTEYPADADPEDYYSNCENAILLVQESLDENSLSSDPVALIARDPDTGELVLVRINQGDYYLAPEFE